MFHNDELNKTAEEFQTEAKKRLYSLDQISSDIRSLEKVLHASAMPEFSYVINKDACLRWIKKRIHYSVSDMCIPLIETKTEIRVECSYYLNSFLQLALYRLKNEVKNEI